MNSKATKILKNMSYSIASNLVSLIVSTLVILIIPKLLGVKEYGYWQLYLFYSSYVGFLHFGWNDGIYLRLGGQDYSTIDKKLFYSQFVELILMQIFVSIIILGSSILINVDIERMFIFKMVALAAILVNTRLMLLYILQATNRIKEYARITMIDRIIYILLIILLIGVGARDYKMMIIADILSKLFSLILTMNICKDIVFNKFKDFHFTASEISINIRVGVNLMFANIASMLIIGIVRFGIEKTWDVVTFGKVSLTLSISNMMMIFINAVGVIIFPILRRTNKKKLSPIYTSLRDILTGSSFAVLLFYYPMKIVLSTWLPQYTVSLLYMALVFPMFIYEGKMALLINTYLKTLRREKVMLKINILSMILSLILTFLATHVWVSINLAIVNIVILLAIRSIFAEIYLAKELGINLKKDMFLDTLLTLVFIVSGWYINSWISTIIYGLCYVIYVALKKKDIIMTINEIKSLMRS